MLQYLKQGVSVGKKKEVQAANRVSLQSGEFVKGVRCWFCGGGGVRQPQENGVEETTDRANHGHQSLAFAPGGHAPVR